MVTLNLVNGETLKLDIAKKADRERFNSLGQSSSNNDSKSSITGIWFNTENHGITLPIPRKFRRVFFYGELLMGKGDQPTGEVITIQADDVRMTVTSYYRKEGKMARVDLLHTGRPNRWNNGGNNA